MSAWELRRGDCTDPLGLPSLEPLSIDVCITDPPYSAHVHSSVRHIDERHGPAAVDLGFGHLTEKTAAIVAHEFARLTRRWVLVFCDFEGIELWRRSLGEAGLECLRVGVWVKPNPMPQLTGDRPATGAEAIVIAHRAGKKRWAGGGRPALWSFGLDRERQHPTQKPSALMEALIRDFTEPGELVLDPFAGSGTTGVAALANGRRFLGWELDESFAKAAAARLGSTREALPLPLGPAAFDRRDQLPMFEAGKKR